MKTYKDEVQSNIVVDTIVCDKCGYEADREDWEIRQNFVELNATFGYGSQHFGDMCSIHLDICEKCLYEMVGEWAPLDESFWGGMGVDLDVDTQGL